MLVQESLSAMENLYLHTYIVVAVILAVILFACLIRAIRGPRIVDRIVAVNMMGTIVMVIIALFSLLFREGYLMDICIIYAMISFLAVVVITKVYLGIYAENHKEGDEK